MTSFQFEYEFEILPVDQLREDPNQPRKQFVDSDIQELAGCIKRDGQAQPIIVLRKADHYLVIDGARRTRALRLEKIPTAKALVLNEAPSEADMRAIQVIVNCHRSDLTPLELVDAYEHMMTTNGWNATQLAERLSRSKGHVSSILKLRNLSPEVREQVISGEISGTTASHLARLPLEEQQKTAKELVSGALKRADLERSSKKSSTKKTTLRKQISFELGEIILRLEATSLPSLNDVIFSCQLLIKRCKRASSEGLDVSTLAQVLKDQASAGKLEVSP